MEENGRDGERRSGEPVIAEIDGKSAAPAGEVLVGTTPADAGSTNPDTRECVSGSDSPPATDELGAAPLSVQDASGMGRGAKHADGSGGDETDEFDELMDRFTKYLQQQAREHDMEIMKVVTAWVAALGGSDANVGNSFELLFLRFTRLRE